MEFSEFFLIQWLIRISLIVVLIGITRWAIITHQQYPGYGLGALMGIFFIIVRLSIGDSEVAMDSETTLSMFHVFFSTVFGLGIGILILLGLRFGMENERSEALLVAVYTALTIVLLFLSFISNAVIQQMVGIFALAIGIATLFSMVIFPQKKPQYPLNVQGQGITGTQGTQPFNSQSANPGQGGGGFSTLDQIRERNKGKYPPRR